MLKMFRGRLTNRKGFTLIELLVVVAIIGILAAIAVPKFQSASDQANRAKIQADMRTIDSASTIYYTANQAYAATVAALVTANYLATEPVTPAVKLTGATIASGTKYALDANGRAIVTGFTWNADAVPALP